MSTLPPISLIAAVARNGIIGKDNDLPWHIADDWKYFMNMTVGKGVIMGRRSYESLKKPLPKRLNIVLTRDKNWAPAPFDNLVICHDWPSALKAAADYNNQEIMIGGGTAIYREALPMASRLYLTEIDAAPEGDTYFPTWDKKHWHELSRLPGVGEPAHDFVVYYRHSSAEE